MRHGAPRTIAIVGAGFSGTIAAVNLLRRPPVGPTRVVLIDRAPDVGRGIAYARRRYPFVLNVPASRMSATSTDTEEFLRFARTRMPTAVGEDFLPRELYGDYLRDLLDRAAAAAPPSIRLEILRACVVDVRQRSAGAAWQLAFAQLGELVADDVVFALGNPPPRRLPEADAACDLPGYVADSWDPARARSPSGPLLVLGSGLTMVDVVAATVATGTADPIHILSRHGLLPLGQTDLGSVRAEHDELDRATVGHVAANDRERGHGGGAWSDGTRPGLARRDHAHSS